jgi:hypothetical protein
MVLHGFSKQSPFEGFIKNPIIATAISPVAQVAVATPLCLPRRSERRRVEALTA